MELPTSRDEVLVWILCGTIAILVLFVGVLLKVLFGKAVNWSSDFEELKSQVRLILQIQDNQKEWGSDLDELKTTTKLILQTQAQHSNRVDFLDREVSAVRSRYNILVDKINEIIMMLEMLRVSGCREDCPVTNTLNRFQQKVRPVDRSVE